MLVIVVGKEAIENAGIAETSKNSENGNNGEYLRTNLAQIRAR